MERWLRQWMQDWDERLANRSNNRVQRPFEWGLDWTAGWPGAGEVMTSSAPPAETVARLNRSLLDRKEIFWSHRTPTDFRLRDGFLQFTSPVVTPSPENNLARARWFPARGGKGNTAVVLLPHWNAQPVQHVALCEALAKSGISTLRLSLPYHDQRMPPELGRADYAVSSNICRTIDATRQAVLDTRACFDWLEKQGFARMGIVGTSLGSCYAFLAAAFDPRPRVAVFNHFSAFYAETVWHGLSTRHIRRTLEHSVSLEELRTYWDLITPANYIEDYTQRGIPALFQWARYDTTFLPEYSEHLLGLVQQAGMVHRAHAVRCGHYSLGEFPFKYLVGYRILQFLKEHL